MIHLPLELHPNLKRNGSEILSQKQLFSFLGNDHLAVQTNKIDIFSWSLTQREKGDHTAYLPYPTLYRLTLFTDIALEFILSTTI